MQNLRRQVAIVRGEIDGLRDSAEATRQTLEEELLRVRGEEEALRALRVERRRLEIQEQLNDARSFGDAESIADLEKSLALLKQINQEQERQLEVRRLPAPTSSEPAPRNGTPRIVSPPATSSSSSFNFNLLILDERDKDRLARDVRQRLEKLRRLNS